MKGSITALLLVLIALGLLGVGIFLYKSQKPLQFSSTSGNFAFAGWNTYVNTAYGYTISYPSGWTALSSDSCAAKNKPATNSDSAVCFTPKPIPVRAGGGTQSLIITTQSKPAGISSKEYFDKFILADIQSQRLPIVPIDTTAKLNYTHSADITVAEGFMGGGIPGPEAYITRNAQDPTILILSTDDINTDLVYKIFSTFKYSDTK